MTFGRRRTPAQLAEEHWAALYRFAFRLTGAAEDAVELTQDTFLKAQAHIDQLPRHAPRGPWLFSLLLSAYLGGFTWGGD